MHKLIDADAVRRIILSHGGNDAMLREIERLPDGRPHGEWAHLGGDEWFCTHCGRVVSTEGSLERSVSAFCPACGADMRGGAE